MARRMAVAQAKRGGKPKAKPRMTGLHPRDAAHPDHAKWLKKMRARTEATWDNMSPAERKKRLDNMAAARPKKPVLAAAFAAASPITSSASMSAIL
jgi:hypothetical protein